MTPQKHRQLVDNLTSMERRVFDVLPTGMALTVGAVVGSLANAGRRVAHSSVERTLNDLVDRGLMVKMDNSFSRVVPREVFTPALADPPPEAVADIASAPVDDTPAPRPDSLSRMATLAAKLRTLQADAAKLASEVEDVALEVEQRIADAGESARKLAELRRLLAGL